MGKQPEKKTANAPDKLFVFGLDEDGKPRGARFAEFNDRVVSAAAQMKLASVHPASPAVAEIGMKLPVGRLYASGKAFVPPIRRDLLRKLTGAREAAGDDSHIQHPAPAPSPEKTKAGGVVARRTISPRRLSPVVMGTSARAAKRAIKPARACFLAASIPLIRRLLHHNPPRAVIQSLSGQVRFL